MLLVDAVSTDRGDVSGDRSAVSDASVVPAIGNAGLIPSVAVACEDGQWCWEAPTQHGAGYTDVLVESPTSVWLASREPATLLRFDGARWSVVRVAGNAAISRFTHDPDGTTWAWGSRVEIDGSFTGTLLRRTATGWDNVALPPNEAPLVVVDGRDSTATVTMQSSLVFTLSSGTWAAITPELQANERIRDACRSPDGAMHFVTTTPLSVRRVFRRSNASWQVSDAGRSNDARAAIACTADGVVLVETLATPGMEINYGTVCRVGQGPPCLGGGEWALQEGLYRTSAGDTVYVNQAPAWWTGVGFAEIGSRSPDALATAEIWLHLDTDRQRRTTVFAREDSIIGTWGVFGAALSPDQSVARRTIVAPPNGGPLRYAMQGRRLLVRDASGGWTSVGGELGLIAVSQVADRVLIALRGDGTLRRIELTNDDRSIATDDALAMLQVSPTDSVAFDSERSGWIWSRERQQVLRWDGTTTTTALSRVAIAAAASDRRGGLWVLERGNTRLFRCENSACTDSGTTLPRGSFGADALVVAPDQTVWIAQSWSAGSMQSSVSQHGESLLVVRPGMPPLSLLADARFVPSSLFMSADGTAYIQSNRGLLRFRSPTSAPERISAPIAASIYATDAGELWITSTKSTAIAHHAP